MYETPHNFFRTPKTAIGAVDFTQFLLYQRLWRQRPSRSARLTFQQSIFVGITKSESGECARSGPLARTEICCETTSQLTTWYLSRSQFWPSLQSPKTLFASTIDLRGVPALLADFVIWMLVSVMTPAETVPESYHRTSPLTISILCFALLAIYGGSIGVRKFALRQRFSIFEIVQCVLAFVLTTWGMLRATKGSASWALGILFLLLSAVFYWGALSYFADEPYLRNRRVSASWAAALLVAGDFLVVSANLRVPFLCLAALAAAFLYSHTRKFSLGLHASFYLLAATTLSPLPAYVGKALAGSLPTTLGWNVWIVGVAAVLCYVVGARVLEDRDKRRLLWVVPAMLAGFTSAASIVVAVSVLAAGRMELSPSRLSVVRTIVNCVLAFALGFAGSRWKHVELRWVAYAAVAFGTLKLPLEDLRFR